MYFSSNMFPNPVHGKDFFCAELTLNPMIFLAAAIWISSNRVSSPWLHLFQTISPYTKTLLINELQVYIFISESRGREI